MRRMQLADNEMEFLSQQTLGERLKWIRQQLQSRYKSGYTINQVTKNLNNDSIENVITAQGLSAIELGKTKKPNARTINALAEYYGIPSEILFDDYYQNDKKQLDKGDALATKEPDRITCHINVLAEEEKLIETLKLTPRQVDLLMKRIRYEISLLQEEQ